MWLDMRKHAGIGILSYQILNGPCRHGAGAQPPGPPTIEGGKDERALDQAAGEPGREEFSNLS